MPITYPSQALHAKVFSEPERPAKPADRGVRVGEAPALPDARSTLKIAYRRPVHVLFRPAAAVLKIPAERS